MANNDLKNPIKTTKAELSARQKQLKVIYDLPKIDLDDDTAVSDRIDYYFTYSAEQGIKPSVEGLALAIGVSRSTLWDWENGRRRAELSDSRADIIKKAKDYIAFLMSDAALENKIFPVTWIFYAKNYFGMKDSQDINIIPNNQDNNTIPFDDLKKLADQHDKSFIMDTEAVEK
jgi:transcriptional regulator with XRE-family HTH domain